MGWDEGVLGLKSFSERRGAWDFFSNPSTMREEQWMAAELRSERTLPHHWRANVAR
jgi:hypothetical protein